MESTAGWNKGEEIEAQGVEGSGGVGERGGRGVATPPGIRESHFLSLALSPINVDSKLGDLNSTVCFMVESKFELEIES